jgi:hypothetical protein
MDISIDITDLFNQLSRYDKYSQIVDLFENMDKEQQMEALQAFYDLLPKQNQQSFIDDNIDDASVEARLFTY